MKDKTGWLQVLFASLFALAVAWLVAGGWGLAAFCLAAPSSVWLPALCSTSSPPDR